MRNLFRKSTKVLAVLLAFGIVAGVASCGEEPVDYSHTILFYSTQGDALQQKTAIAIAAFEAKYPGWTVKHTQPGGYDEVKDKIISDLQGGLQPDVAYCYADHVAQYIQSQKVVDIAPFINSTETIATMIGGAEQQVQIGYTSAEIADFVPGYYAEGFATNYGDYEKYGYSSSTMFTLPFVKSTELLYYNKTVLDALGFSVAQTWDELWEQSAAIVKKYPTATALGYDSEANWFITMCEQNGWGYTQAAENHFLFNNANAQAWLEKLNGLYEQGYIITQNEYGSYTSNLFVKGADDGGIVYCVGSSGGASYQDSKGKFEWGVAPIPGSKLSDGSISKKVISQGPSLVMFKTDYSENVDEKQKMTFLFVKELLEPTFQAAFSIQSGYNPCRISSNEIDEYKEHLAGTTITAVAARVASTMTDNFFTSPAFVGSSTARDQVGNALKYALTGEKTAAKALADAYGNCGGK